jgi:hypothetical protein
MRVCLGIHSAVAWAAVVRACAWAWCGGPLGRLDFQVHGSATGRSSAPPYAPLFDPLTPNALCASRARVCTFRGQAYGGGGGGGGDGPPPAGVPIPGAFPSYEE